ncbi:alpha/beta hydrolase [Sphingomonas koreensis]|uniref:Alpha/beta hydrolase n=1 Tax=Sphingomonas koreensis TaxID=93064 RepID=A0AAJ4S151_9SPHN|nr:alpha/beta hydrolase [Sphingomonas koreensis]RSU22108.1 alpha/beta hydrolase [Sphingomonas koreensis]RSU24291.1 alpha/beta hydrolase [Sphingomonas koreensis]RSU33322.1 alpha/beta hydrolase [Sphingomonas koreensis]RSU35221.1 alpha/beta hydrolase [Sphingomonas koreensis]
MAVLALSACGNAAPSQPAVTGQSGAPAQRGGGQAYELLGTEVWDVPDPATGRSYQLFVSLPPSYGKEPQRRYPVLYVTDADYAFPVIRQIARRLNVEGPKIEEFILIGISYAKGDDPVASRRRDYTPTPNGPSDTPAGTIHGEGAKHQAWLRDKALPFVTGRYRSAPGRGILLGHSYGGLLAAQILFSEPEMFGGYVLGSPSLWYDKRHMFGVEAAYAARHRDLKAKVFVYTGEYEALRRGDSRYNQSADLVADSRELADTLRRRGYPGLTLEAEILNGEDHVSVAPRGFTRALKFLLPVQK